MYLDGFSSLAHEVFDSFGFDTRWGVAPAFAAYAKASTRSRGCSRTGWDAVVAA
jgi:hypothetical protein